jgi:predicted PurR-regulated permease PerM
VDILRAAVLVFGVWFGLKLLWVAYPLLFVAFLGILFGLAVSRGADLLERMRIPRGLGAALIVFGFLGLLVGLGAWAGPTLKNQLGELRTAVPQAIDQVEAWIGRNQGGMLGQFLPAGPNAAPATGQAGATGQPAPPAAQGATGQTAGQAPPNQAAGGQPPAAGAPPADTGGQPSGAFSGLPDTLSGQLGAVTRYLFSFLSSTVAVVTGIFLILVLSIYIGAAPKLYQSGMLHLVPHHARPRATQVLEAIGGTLQRWLRAQLIAMAVIGVVTTLGLWALDVKAALALGIIAGLLEFIPLVGPLLSAIPAVAMGFLDSPQKALLVILLYTGIQLLENHILIPIVMKEGVDLPPVLTILGLGIMAAVFGFLGMLVAVPLLAAIVVAVKMLYVQDVVGDDVKTVSS